MDGESSDSGYEVARGRKAGTIVGDQIDVGNSLFQSRRDAQFEKTFFYCALW